MNKTLVVIVGATACGKTHAAIELAQQLRTEIVSADARQIYREMSIGTAKPSDEELRAVKHYFINSHSIHDDFNAGQFEKEALQTLQSIFETHDTALLVGGSGLYVSAVCEGIDTMPTANPAIREALTQQWQQQGLESLLNDLKRLDEVYYHEVDKQNPSRILRALEVCLVSGKPYSAFRQESNVMKKHTTRPFRIVKIGLERPRQELYRRIDERVDVMLANGLLDEVKTLYPYKHLKALQTVGYQEFFGYLDGQYDYAEAVRLVKRNTRHYAKRQLTWFRRDTQIQWQPADKPIALFF